MKAVLALAVALLSSGCGLWPFSAEGPGPAPDPQGLELVDDAAVLELYGRASAFYGRLARRRFDSIETFQDEALRGFFRSEATYTDYYADLAGALVEAHFEKNRPISLEVLELRLEGPSFSLLIWMDSWVPPIRRAWKPVSARTLSCGPFYRTYAGPAACSANCPCARRRAISR